MEVELTGKVNLSILSKEEHNFNERCLAMFEMYTIRIPWANSNPKPLTDKELACYEEESIFIIKK
ncbi:MAG: hypothetical protein M9962_11960 [Oligoflexia bacterium]|nr:hypothetical protein [Oligoflexia bacterium]